MAGPEAAAADSSCKAGSLTPPPAGLHPITYQNGFLPPPVQRAVVKTFSIDKLRPVCPVCNPVGDIPYPSLPSPPKLPRNNNFSDEDDNPEEEVKKLNSELEELQKCLLSGAADLAEAIEKQDRELISDWKHFDLPQILELIYVLQSK